MFLLWLCLLSIAAPIYGQFVIPKLIIEAFQPAGFRVALDETPGVQMFAFHGSINQELMLNQPGDFSGEILKPSKDGRFVYDNPDLRLKVGDTVYYWIYIQHDGLGFRLDNQTWRVTALRSKNELVCKASATVVSNRKSVCSGQVIFEDDFSGNSLNTNKWLLEQYIPTQPDYEFNIYVNDSSVTSIHDNRLTIRPKIRNEDLKEEWLDLSDGCTRIPSRRAKCRNKLYMLHHPIASARLVSKVNFLYGEVEVRARLPSGDWMYPEIYLEDENNQKLIIAYARGNTVLLGNDASNDLGGTLLFGGPIVNDREPERSSHLSSYKTPTPLSYNFHTYKLKWTAEKLELYLNDNKYGSIGQEVLKSTGFSSDPLKVHLVLGVGVGGITDFPDGFKGNYDKPWKNSEINQVKKFYENRSKWEPSWFYGGELLVDYVKITAI
ncbi:unnamed protein product [Phyllotreta striolata]|uniref:Glycoside hydrolase family 16 n=1 Tax=Phyllotreta striolata TaxID=444603 RepID=A0A9N9TI23_PHYSR|nr:unnamed protein product [Phyllotreta striolata]